MATISKVTPVPVKTIVTVPASTIKATVLVSGKSSNNINYYLISNNGVQTLIDESALAVTDADKTI
jgi:hypothetical protein